jgi:hypothetical protein
MQILPILTLAAFSIVRPIVDPMTPKIEGCLTKREMREAIDDRRAVQPLIALKAAGAGEKIRAELCKTESGLVYLITALGRDGHVSRVFVDAASGQRVGSR